LSASTLARVCTSGRCGGTGIFCLQNNFFPRPDPPNWLRLAAAPGPVPQRAGYLSASCDGTQGNNGLGVSCSLTRPKIKGYGGVSRNPTALVMPLPRETRSSDAPQGRANSDAPQGSAQGKTGRVQAYLLEATVVKQPSDRQRADAKRLPTCATKEYPG